MKRKEHQPSFLVSPAALVRPVIIWLDRALGERASQRRMPMGTHPEGDTNNSSKSQGSRPSWQLPITDADGGIVYRNQVEKSGRFLEVWTNEPCSDPEAIMHDVLVHSLTRNLSEPLPDPKAKNHVFVHKVSGPAVLVRVKDHSSFKDDAVVGIEWWVSNGAFHREDGPARTLTYHGRSPLRSWYVQGTSMGANQCKRASEEKAIDRLCYVCEERPSLISGLPSKDASDLRGICGHCFEETVAPCENCGVIHARRKGYGIWCSWECVEETMRSGIYTAEELAEFFGGENDIASIRKQMEDLRH